MIDLYNQPKAGKIKRLHMILLIFLFLFIAACHDGKKSGNNAFKDFTVKNSELHQSINAASLSRIRNHIDSLRLSERDTNFFDAACNRYYAEHKPFLWISRCGIDNRCDTLLEWIEKTEPIGISLSKFYIKSIREDLKRVRNMDFDNGNHSASKTLANLEYHLTKSYFRYASGQRYGYTNPHSLFGKVNYDLPTERPDDKFFHTALEHLNSYNINHFLEEIQPQGNLFQLFCNHYNEESDKTKRKILAINIERARWRMTEAVNTDVEIIVNVPAQELYAHHLKSDSSCSMKICYGAVETKTPLLRSTLTHLDLNPYWIIPPSITKNSIANHASDSSYLARHRYEVIEKSTGRKIPRGQASSTAMREGKYTVRQERGEGNSLGRIIYRFPNHFSVYMHDTNNRSAFMRETRALSHGCIRLEHPFKLAQFLLGHKGEDYVDEIWEAIHFVNDTTKTENSADKEIRTIPTGTRKFDQSIDLWITYFTCFPDPKTNALRYYRDIYDYDRKIASKLF